MGMSGVYGPADEAESIATIRAALDAGITLLDTGDFYGMGHNELLLREALRGVDRSSVFIQVKFGGQRDPGGAFVGYDASPAAVKNSLAYTLTRLGTDYIDLYQPARLDPRVPIEETVGAIAEMIQAGYVRYAGLSEMGAETIRRAQRGAPGQRPPDRVLADEPGHRGAGPARRPRARHQRDRVRDPVPRAARRRAPARSAATTRGPRFPRFQGENLRRNLDLLAALEQVAARARRDRAAARVRLGAVPRPGHHPAHRHQAPGPAGRGARARSELRLGPGELAALEAAVPAGQVAGDRYDAAHGRPGQRARRGAARGDNSKTRGETAGTRRRRRARGMITERFAAQLLTGEPARSAEEVTGRLLAVQGQDPRGARLAIRARIGRADRGRRGPGADADRSLLITWLNRGTLHLVRSEDYWWLHAAARAPAGHRPTPGGWPRRASRRRTRTRPSR